MKTKIRAEREREGCSLPAKNSRCLCKYLNTWEEAYSHLMKSSVGHSPAFCKICCTDFSASRITVESAKHKRAKEAQKHGLPMTVYTISPIYFQNHPLYQLSLLLVASLNITTEA